jgi:CelD/BcsL family acetyltransferase involved in cellulose biosynthesis
MAGTGNAGESGAGSHVSMSHASMPTKPVVPASATRGYRPMRAEARWFRSFSEVAPLLDGLEGSVFQSRLWLECWYSTFAAEAAIEPLLLLLRDHDGEVILACPLIRRRAGRLLVFEFPDLGVSDYAAPLLRRSALALLPSGAELWRMLAAALPTGDLVRFDRLAPLAAGMPNPLLGAPKIRESRIAGWKIPEIDNWESYFGSLSARQQDNLNKNRRRFLRHPGAEICIHKSPQAAQEALARLELLQQTRMSGKGLSYQLDTPRIAAFYRALVEQGTESGQTLMVELRAGDEMVAANFTVLAGMEAVYLRVGNQFGEWGKMSPGVMVTELAMQEAVRRGVTMFDFGMGDYVYKRRLGAVKMPLRDLIHPLSIRGVAYALAWHARQWAATSPFLRRLTGRSVARESPAGQDDSASAA